MGVCASKDALEKARKSSAIDKDILKEREQLQYEVKMLLLGAGEAGKSTILKQMKLIHGNGYDDNDRVRYRSIIYYNVTNSMRVMLDAMQRLGIALDPPENQVHADLIKSLPPAEKEEQETLTKDVAEAVRELWKDRGIQQVFGRQAEYQLSGSPQYYYNDFDRISASGYVPTDKDILMSRVRTSGISESKFQVGKMKYRMFDVGGQRSERRKWITCFENTTAVIFIVALSEYDQRLMEDETTNRLDEALVLFDLVCNSRWLVNTNMILFLNKMDLFQQKLATSNFASFFPDYQGPSGDFNKTTAFIRSLFLKKNQNPETKKVYIHLTCATDTEQIKFVMAAVNDIILRQSLAKTGLM